jgi:hypothetical protein
MPFLAANLKAHPTPLSMMVGDGDHDKCPWGEGPSQDCRQPSFHRARMDAAPSRVSSLTRWGFTLRQQFAGRASCRSTDLHLFIGVGLLLLQTWWQHWLLGMQRGNHRESLMKPHLMHIDLCHFCPCWFHRDEQHRLVVGPPPSVQPSAPSKPILPKVIPLYSDGAKARLKL